MTTESARDPATLADADLVAALWEEAPFARLPWDAPSELRESVAEVENPRRVYTIHRASRRHNFQITVQLYIIQLREGCGVSTCCQPTCFTCRKRVAGKAPLRRYNTTSARMLAVHLASQDNPEAGLCPALRLTMTPPAALSSLVFTSKYGASTRDDSGGALGSHKVPPKERPTAAKPSGGAGGAGGRTGSGYRGSGLETDRALRSQTPRSAPAAPAAQCRGVPDAPKFDITEKPVSKDYRSFAANMFGTVAFKMLEWLTPAAVQDMSDRAERLQGGPPSPAIKGEPSPSKKEVTTVAACAPVEEVAASQETKNTTEPASAAISSDEIAPTDDITTATNEGGAPMHKRRNDASPQTAAQPTSHSHPAGQQNTSSSPWRNSSARVRAPSSTMQPQRKLSVDTFPTDPTTDDLLPAVRSPRVSSMQGDNMGPKPPPTKPIKSTAQMPRPISQISNTGFFDGIPLEKMPPPKTQLDVVAKQGKGLVDGTPRNVRESSSLQTPAAPVSRPPSTHSSKGGTAVDGDHDAGDSLNADDSDSLARLFLPQTLTQLNVEIVDFLCDTLQNEFVTEQHMLEPPTITRFHTKSSEGAHPRMLKRKIKPSGRDRHNPQLGQEWRLFSEQSFFYVLSNPRALFSSFTRHGLLYDSQSLWYCMLRLTRVAPCLVFHSLWMAAAALFEPPKALRAIQAPKTFLYSRARCTPLTNTEAGMLISICLHALVAAAPLVDDMRKLYDVSRVRSQGLSLTGSFSDIPQDTELCLQYDDAFSHDLAVRLARRLLAAIVTRRYFNELMENEAGAGSSDGSDSGSDSDTITPGKEVDVLAPLFRQLNFLNMDAACVLSFSVSDRTIHETRVPTLLLDWARAVMFYEWDGNPIVSSNSSFGGALALMAAIYERRQELLVGDVQFYAQHFSDRLDDVGMPIAWLSYTSTKERPHLLDFPYIFTPTMLVSYFRAINYSRMSRAFAEANSLYSRMSAVISPRSLVIDPHHQMVLHDSLRTAAAKYLVLDISRRTVLSDAFDQLWRREERELLRPLKVHIGEQEGEEGFDSGGVQQEFFRIAIAEALNPDYGAFTVDTRTRMAWFNPAALEEDWKFELVGLLVSLAVYNGLSLPVTFPKALYRKLLGEPVNELHHIADGWPDLANGLTTLLEWNEQDGTVEDVFVLTYEFSVDLFGRPITRVMDASGTWPNLREQILRREPDTSAAGWRPAEDAEIAESGEKTAAVGEDGDKGAPMVTDANRNAYVTDYIRYLTDVSVRRQYEAFSRGFRACLHEKSIRLLTPALLQKLVEGEQEIDVAALQRHVRYVGWTASHRTVRDFWSIVGEYDDTMKRKLLEFVTSTERVPVGGVKNLQFVLQRNGEEDGPDGHLPTAYTCYGILLLPEYRDRAVLQERLAMALQNAQGFGFA